MGVNCPLPALKLIVTELRFLGVMIIVNCLSWRRLPRRGPTKIRNEAKCNEMKRNEHEMQRNEHEMRQNELEMHGNEHEMRPNEHEMKRN